MRIYFDQDTYGSTDEDLQEAGLVEWRVEKRQQTLMSYVGSGVCDVSSRFCKNPLMIVAVQEGILDLSLSLSVRASITSRMTRNTVGLEASLRKDNIETFSRATGSDMGLYREHCRIGGFGNGMGIRYYWCRGCYFPSF